MLAACLTKKPKVWLLAKRTLAIRSQMGSAFQKRFRSDTMKLADCNFAPDDTGLDSWERKLWASGWPVVVGVDEAGCGPLAGPVVAAAFSMLKHDDAELLALLATICDSKQMTEKRREVAYDELTDARFKERLVYAVCESCVEEIDSSDILRATMSAMGRAVQALDPVRADVVLVDGCNRPPDLLPPGAVWTRGTKKTKKASEQPVAFVADDGRWRPQHVMAIKKGDGRVPSISAASVLAKVHRDRLMRALHDAQPEYGLDKHKGYGTKAHLLAIKEHGVRDFHRKSFAPVRAALGLELKKRQSDASRRPASSGAGAPPPARHTSKCVRNSSKLTVSTSSIASV